MADLDAANIASIMETNGVSMSEAIMTYQQQLESGQETRATIFLKYNSLEDVEKEILAELNVATRDELNNSNLAGAYNFICSLEEGLNELEDFVNE